MKKLLIYSTLTLVLVLVLVFSSTQQKNQVDIISQINRQIQEHPPAATGGNIFSAFVPTDKFVLMDFDDSVLHDKAWFSSQQEGFAGIVVKGKGNTKASIAIGEGRNGSNALLLETFDENAGLPGFLITKPMVVGGQASTITSKEAYLIPSNIKANRFEFWVRFENGFRFNSSSAFPPSYPNHQNLQVGTFHFDPSKINGTDPVIISDNWSFTHQLFLRHDKAGTDWIRVTINKQPQKQLGTKNSVPNNPTMPAGSYYNLLTRLYVDLVQFTAPEIPYPVKMWVDDVELSYVSENPDLTIVFLDRSEGTIMNILNDEETLLPVNIINNNPVEVCGILSINAHKWLNSTLSRFDGTDITSNNSICLDANSSEIFNFSVNPYVSTGVVGYVGLTFANELTFQSNSDSTNPSLMDNNVEKRWHTDTGPHDSVVSSNFIKLKIIAN